VPYRGQAAANLRKAKLAATTQGDKSGAQLLAKEYDKIDNPTGKYLEKRVKLEFIDPHSMDDDLLNQKIPRCARSLAAMATSNPFLDDGSCH
jgi:hypothetical protein